MLPFVALFLTTTVLVMVLGSRQKSSSDRVYGLASTALLAFLAAALIFFTQGTLFFPANAAMFAILVFAYGVIVRFASEEDERPAVFRLESLKARETWIVAALTAALVSGFRL